MKFIKCLKIGWRRLVSLLSGHREEIKEHVVAKAATKPADFIESHGGVSAKDPVVVQAIALGAQAAKEASRLYSHGSHLIALCKLCGAAIPTSAKSLGSLLWSGFFACSCSPLACVALGVGTMVLLGAGLHAFVHFVS